MGAGETYAQFTNAHSACYILTRDQLRRAIASGGFMTEPYAGEYDMLYARPIRTAADLPKS